MKVLLPVATLQLTLILGMLIRSFPQEPGTSRR